MSASNRFALVDRELIDGTIEGVNFGPLMQVIARSPEAVLVWKNASSTSVNGHRLYSDPDLLALPNRHKPIRGWLKYERWLEGGRLSLARLDTVADKIGGLFGEETVDLIREAVRRRKTLLIEGGGPAMRPAYSLGMGAHRAWEALPERGFLNPLATHAAKAP